MVDRTELIHKYQNGSVLAMPDGPQRTKPDCNVSALFIVYHGAVNKKEILIFVFLLTMQHAW